MATATDSPPSSYRYPESSQRKFLHLAVTTGLVLQLDGAFRPQLFGMRTDDGKRHKTPREMIAEAVLAFCQKYPGQYPGLDTMDGLVEKGAKTRKPLTKDDFLEEWRAIRATAVPDQDHVIAEYYQFAHYEELQHALGPAQALLDRGPESSAAVTELLRTALDKVNQIGKPPAEREGPALLCLGDVAPEQVTWLWLGYFAAGKVSLVIGDPETGKSFLTHDLAARISKAKAWPDGSGTAPAGEIIVLTAEDGLADTVRPRVDEAGGDARKVHILEGVRLAKDGSVRPFNLAQDLPHLETALHQHRECRLVIIDPLSAYLGKTDSYKDAEVRAVLAPLAKLAETYHVAIIGIMHLTKNEERRAIARAPGSIGFVAAARAVFAVGRDRTDPTRRLVAPVKMNFAAKPPALSFRLEPKVAGGAIARVIWCRETPPVDAETVLAGPESPEKRDALAEAMKLLTESFKTADHLDPDTMKASGIPATTLYRARRQLGIEAKRVGGLGKEGKWIWRKRSRS